MLLVVQLLNYRTQKRIKHTYQFNSIHKIFGLIHLGFYVCARVRANKVIIQLNGKNMIFAQVKIFLGTCREFHFTHHSLMKLLKCEHRWIKGNDFKIHTNFGTYLWNGITEFSSGKEHSRYVILKRFKFIMSFMAFHNWMALFLLNLNENGLLNAMKDCRMSQKIHYLFFKNESRLKMIV